MLSGVVFGRKKRRGSKGPHAEGDLFVSRVREGGKSDRQALSLRLHRDVMKKLRWTVGDFVILRFGDDSATEIILDRVDGPEHLGMRLCGDDSKAHAHGTVRFAMETDTLNAIFAPGMTSFLASFCEVRRTVCAVFVRD